MAIHSLPQLERQEQTAGRKWYGKNESAGKTAQFVRSQMLSFVTESFNSREGNWAALIGPFS
jgi:hypothetical protein